MRRFFRSQLGITRAALVVLALVPSCSRRLEGPTPAVFREQVMVILAEEFPARTFVRGTDVAVVKCGTAEFGLQNLRAKYLDGDDRSRDTLRSLVRDHFRPGLAALDGRSAATGGWADVRPLLRPQLAPREYLDRLPLAHEAFNADLVKAYVLDQPESYQFVLREDLTRWGIRLEELRGAALANLDALRGDVPLEKVSLGPDAFVILSTHDGYDAVRLLSPRTRAEAAKVLGSPFLAAIPNRDLLVMWAVSASPAFQKHARAQAAEDFRSRPYPFTRSVFEVTAEAIREVP